MESNNKRSKKGRKAKQQQQQQQQPQDQQQPQEQLPQEQHHPWDEVSLPGAGTGTLEQPTILLINQKPQQQQQQPQLNGDNEAEAEAEAVAKPEEEPQVQEKQSKAAALKLNLDTPNLTRAASLTASHSPTTPGGSHVLDIESHLIEDANGQEDSDEQGIGINELPPIEQELQQGTSKVETDDVAQVIEVQPAGAKTKQAIETLAPPHQTAEVDETALPSVSDAVRQIAEQLVDEIEQRLIETPSVSQAVCQTSKQLVDETEQQLIETPSVSDAVRQTAEQLVDEIEQQLIETLSRDVDEQQTKTETETEDLRALHSLSQQVDAQLNELTSILKSKPLEDQQPLAVTVTASNELKLVEVPTPKTEAEEQQRKDFIDSLPQIEQQSCPGAGAGAETDANRLSADCKREYYQSLKKYLLQSSLERPPVPLQTYRWEDVRRAKERGGYPWTHLYKRPLGPDEEPEIVLLLRKSQELRFKSESPKSLKKVRYDEQVLVKETERYIQDLSEDEALGDTEDDTTEHSDTESEIHNEDALSECISCVSDSVLAVGGHAKPRKTNRLAQIRNIIRRRRSGRTHEDAQSLPGNSANASRQSSVHELAPPPGALLPSTSGEAKSKAERKPKQSFDIMKKLKSLAERQKKRLNIRRITLKKDEKIVLGEEQKIMRLKASPKSDRGEIPHFIEKQDSDDILELVEYDESPCRKRNKAEEEEELPTTSSSVLQPDEVIELPAAAPTVEVTEPAAEQEPEPAAEAEVTTELAAEEDAAPPKKTPRLRREHVYEEIAQSENEPEAEQLLQDVLDASSVDALKKSLTRQDHLAVDDIEAAKAIPLDRMGSSEEEQAASAAADKSNALLAPISSIDSTSSDEERARLAQLSPVAEESDVGSHLEDELRPTLKKEPSPAPSDKKVTFSHVEDEAEPHREDIELPEDVLEAAANATKWKNVSDHEYEPIGVAGASGAGLARESSPAPTPTSALAGVQNGASHPSPMDIDAAVDEHYLSSTATTPRTESRTDYEIHTSQVDSSALEELPLKPENRKKGFMATAQDRTRKMQDGLRNQAGKIRTKLRPQPKKPASGSPKAKERRRFKAPEFSKIKMPEIKRPDMSKFKELKRPEFTKFSKPDMSKFKLPEFSTLKLRRSKSLKENEPATGDSELPTESTESPTTPTAETAPVQKKKFEFNFGTYPRAFRKKKPVEPVAVESSLGTEGLSLSVIPSTETQQSSTSSPQGDRGPGPVRSRWADKFSDVSYNDSEGSRYRRYGSEMESFDRESSLERRMKEDLEDTGSEAQQVQQEKQDLGILSGVADSKQFAEFDEENRAIHEISNLRSREFKRRPMVHQDSDLRSEDSRDAEGWTEKDIQKNKLLRKAELEAEAGYYQKYQGEESLVQDAQSTASSGKKVVMEEIDDDEFFLRKRGVSEDNIQLRQYISAAIREGYDMPNALQHVGQASEPPLDYDAGDYDVPPPKPRRLHKNYRPEYGDSQEFQRSDYGDDLSMSQNGSDFHLPKRPMRKARSRSKYSMDADSQADIPMADEGSSVQYFEDDEEYLRPPAHSQAAESAEADEEVPRPQAPRRQKKRTRDDASVEKEADGFINGFGGRSVSNTFLQPQEDVIVYRTEHEYHHIPLATPDRFTDGTSDARTSRGADSLMMDGQTKSEQPLPDEVEQEQEEKFVIDMLESDGYAVVRKEQLPKPTPPARRKKFTRSPGERFATLPIRRGSRGSPPPARPPPPKQYTPSEDSPLPPRRRSVGSLDEIAVGFLVKSNYEIQQPKEDDYEEPEALERPESPRANLHSGEVINKMKYRPLPPPPRPPRSEKRSRGGLDGKGGDRTDEELSSTRYEDSERVGGSSTADSYDQHEFEVEVSTQTDPLPDDFVCEEFEITEDMKIIEPSRSTGTGRTLEDLLRSSQAEAEQDELDGARTLTEDEQLARGLQRFREANQRSLSERSRASSQADRSRSLSRPQTPSAVVIERRVPTPLLTEGIEDNAVQASLIVRPISAADLADEELRREEEELRREGLLSDSSVQSKSDVETAGEEEEAAHVALSDYAASSTDLDAAVEKLQQAQLESSDYEGKLEDAEVERTLREYEEEEQVEAEASEKYSDQYEEEEDWEKEEELTEKEMEEALEKELQEQQDLELEALEKELQEEMEKELAAYRKAETLEAEVSSAVTREEEEKAEAVDEPLLVSEIHKQSETTAAEPTEAEVEAKFIATLPTEPAADYDYTDEPEHMPQPPPRRKSTTALEPIATSTLTIVEQAEQPAQTSAQPQKLPESAIEPQAQLPSRLAELEVERLRVHALQAGQIMVSQLHGTQISAEELECKSGHLVVQNLELPPGFIEDIVERVRSSEPRPALLTTETQTSRQPSSEPAASEDNAIEEPPLKPPRQSKAAEAAPTASTSQSQRNLDEQTQTEAALLPLPPPPPVYPSVEYLQSLAPLAFFNLQRSAEAEQAGAADAADRKAPHKCRRRHVQRQEDEELSASGSELDEQLAERPHSRSRRSRTRSGTQSRQMQVLDEDEPKSVVQAGRQFISACSLELVNIINQLTNYVRAEAVEQVPQQQQRNISALMVLFILITFGVLVFLLTGRQVHTHHWDYFNPPGNEGRQT